MFLNKKNCGKFGLRKIEGPKEYFSSEQDLIEGELWHRYGKGSGSSLYEYSKEFGVYVQQWRSANKGGWQEREHLSIVISPNILKQMKDYACSLRLHILTNYIYQFENDDQMEDTIQSNLEKLVTQIKMAIEESTEYWERICAEVEAEKEAVS